MKIQRMFSNVGEEKLYSTGNDELDDLLERAFCEGYEYAQREFGYVNPTQAKNFFTKVSKGTGKNRLSSSMVRSYGGNKSTMKPLEKSPTALDHRIGIDVHTGKPTLMPETLHTSISTRMPNSYLNFK